MTRKRDRPPDPYLGPLGAALRQLRQKSSRSTRDVAAVTELTANEVSEYERGARRPGIDNLVRYLRGVDADLADLKALLDEEAGPLVEREAPTGPRVEDWRLEELERQVAALGQRVEDEALEQRLRELLRRLAAEDAG